MPNTPLPADQTKVSYILPKSQKKQLARFASALEISMSEVITQALLKARVLKKAPAKKKGEDV